MNIVYNEEIPARDQKTYESKLLFLSFRLEIITFAALIILSLTALSSYTWSVANTEVVHTGIKMGLNTAELQGLEQDSGSSYKEISDSRELLSDSDVFMPGSIITFSVGLYNSQTASFAINRLYLETPKVWIYDGPTSSYPLTESAQLAYNECPIWNSSARVFDYFGKQLTIQITECTIYEGAIMNDGVIDLTKPGITSETFDLTNWHAEVQNFLEDESEPSEITLFQAPSGGGESMTLEPGALVTFTLRIEFVNESDKSQNIFMNFGNYKSDGTTGEDDDTGINYPGGRCARTISADFSEILQ